MTEVTSRREQRRLEHQELNRHQVLDAAEEVFGEKGFHEATLKEIAEQAGFAVGSVYMFFDGKDDLFAQLLARRGSEFMDEMRDVLADGPAGDGDALHQLHALVDVQVGFFRRHPHFGRLFLRHASTSLLSPEASSSEPRFGESMRLQADLFGRGQAVGTFVAGDPDVMARLFSGLISTFQSLDLGDDGATDRFTLDELHALIERSFVRGPDPQRR